MWAYTRYRKVVNPIYDKAQIESVVDKIVEPYHAGGYDLEPVLLRGLPRHLRNLRGHKERALLTACERPRR